MNSRKSRQNANNKPYSYQQLGAEVQNSKKSKVYVFGDADVQEDEIVEFEMSDVRSRKGGPKTISKEDDEQLYYEREITEGDTLRSLSLQYGCPVAEIKRINNMIQDQEFYAFKKIKVPIKKYSFLTETIKTKTESEKPQFNGLTVVDETDTEHTCNESDSESTCNMSDPDTQRLLIKKSLSIRSQTGDQSKDARRFLRSMDKDLAKICKSAKTNHKSLDEVVSLLTNRSIQPIPPPRRKFFGADCGITWCSMIIVMVILVILIPLGILSYLWFTGHFNSTSQG
ncbi:lysM and putative peptidoglycan-binding domain-containing protein 3-like [Saccostrea cucullata]|uniref:lysM and putative peptidoglycan-binding domain-containing protein 3-like n=1 Tax=Saccostrea cuccullata TaxID=36930 RepID=UPI002ED4D862